MERKFYLIGGRGLNPVNVFDPKSNHWNKLDPPPVEIQHYQPVVYQNAIYIIGGMTGGYPTETPLGNIYLYHPHKVE